MADKQRRNSGRPWKPGQSGNPAGRPPKPRCIPDILERIGREPVPGNLKKDIPGAENKLEAVMLLVYECALDGKPWAVQFIAERLEGKVAQIVENKNTHEPELDLSGLSYEELELWESLCEKAEGGCQ